MSAFCPRRSKPSRNPAPRDARGFTLLEILVVLALVGLMTAFSLPQISVMQDRIAFTLSRESFETELSGISYAAFKQGRPMILAGAYPRSKDQALTVIEEWEINQAKEAPFLEDGQLRGLLPANAVEAAPQLPEKWRMTVEKPIVYQPSGYCGGGAVSAGGEQAGGRSAGDRPPRRRWYPL